MKTHILELNGYNAIDIFKHVEAMPYSLLLDSADETHGDSKYSFVACMPIEMIEANNGTITMTSARGQKKFENEDPFKFVQKRLRHHRLSVLKNHDLPPFQGGAAGFFGYDIGQYIEELPQNASANPDMPDMAIGIYDQVFSYNHETQEGILITYANTAHEAKVKQQHFLKIIEQPARQFSYQAFEPQWENNFTHTAYKKLVQKVINYIKAGDIFQANVSQKFSAELPSGFDSFAHYLNMRDVSPAPFSSYFNLGHVKISSSSPERFLTLKGDMVETKPIKGTRPHLKDDLCMDKLHRNSLENSAKDRAENIMIVDLLRNDLSKTCRPDSVEVLKLCALETFATVHHLVSTVTAKLRQGYDGLDLLRGCFPGGSITGAPKIRAMEIIDELEPTVRGPYCGSMGYIGFDGNMDTNILIRTLVYQGNQVSFQVGGGIVADSKAEEEYDETLAKAAGLLKSFTDTKEDKKKKAA